MKFLIFILCLIGSNVFASSHPMTPVEKAGACSQYHLLWWGLTLKNNSIADASFSDNIYKNLKDKYKGNKEFRDASDRANKHLANALQSKNSNVVKGFAGFCADIGVPIGRNTGK